MILTEEMREKMVELFTIEDRHMIQKMMDENATESIASAILIQTPIQESWLQSVLQTSRPEYVILESEVEKEMLEATRRGEVIDTPEKEKAWQDKLDAEKAGTPIVEPEIVVMPEPAIEVEDATDEPETDERAELKLKLDELGIAYAKNAKLKKLQTLLAEATSITPTAVTPNE